MRPTLPAMLIGFTHLAEVVRLDADQILLSLPDADQADDELDLIPMPIDDAPNATAGMRFEVFVHNDSQGFPIATIDKPLVDLDNSGRLAASSRIDHHLSDEPEGFSGWQTVSLLIFQRTDLGFKAVVDDRAVGLLYRNEIFQPLRVGDKLEGFVKQVRNDGRLDLALQKPSRLRPDELPERIIEWLKQHDGVSTLTDRSDPQQIMATYKVSKKNYKKALSTLYRERRIIIEPTRIVLKEKNHS